MRANGWFRCVAISATAAFLWTIAVSASPGLHQRIHGDQHRVDHSCAATFVRSGSYHHAAVPTLSRVGQLTEAFGPLLELTSHWVASPFLCSAVFEHAPPHLS